MVCTYSEGVCSGACPAGDVERTAIYRLNKCLFSGRGGTSFYSPTDDQNIVWTSGYFQGVASRLLIACINF